MVLSSEAAYRLLAAVIVEAGKDARHGNKDAIEFLQHLGVRPDQLARRRRW